MWQALRFLTDPLLAGVTVVVVQADEFRHCPEVAAVLTPERSVRLAQGPLQPTDTGGSISEERWRWSYVFYQKSTVYLSRAQIWE